MSLELALLALFGGLSGAFVFWVVPRGNSVIVNSLFYLSVGSPFIGVIAFYPRLLSQDFVDIAGEMLLVTLLATYVVWRASVVVLSRTVEVPAWRK